MIISIKFLLLLSLQLVGANTSYLRAPRDLESNKDTGMTGNVGRYNSFFFDTQLAERETEVLFEMGPITVSARCEKSAFLDISIIDKEKEYLIDGEIRTPVLAGKTHHILEKGDEFAVNGFWRQYDVGNDEPYDNKKEESSGALRLYNRDEGEPYFFAWNGDTIVGVYDQKEMQKYLGENVLCIISGVFDFVNPGNGNLKPPDRE